MKRILGGAGAAIGAKLVTGLAVAAFAAAGAAAVTEAGATGSLNPADWGQQVKQQVAACKAALTSGQHGIGECVSAFAKQHGDQVSDQHQASGARENHGSGKDKGQGQSGQGQGDGQGQNGKGHDHQGNNDQGNGQPPGDHGKPSSVPQHP
jgi:hypothetical protein